MRINHNIAALNTYRQFNNANAAQGKSMEKLSSGLRINSAADDAAGLAISEKMRGQIRGLDQASKNSQDGISMIQTAEGALNETHDILQRMRELSNQSANGTATDEDRGAMQDELNQLTSEINRIGNTTEFNTQKLLNGGIGSNDGVKLTKANNASVTGGTAVTGGAISTSANLKVTVDGTTFNLGGQNVGNDLVAEVVASDGPDGTTGTADDVAGSPEIPASTAKENADALISKFNEATAGGTKLSDLVDITSDDSGVLTFKAKSSGDTSKITFSGTTTGTGIGANATSTGSPSTVERHGVQASSAVNGSTIIAANSAFKVAVGSESAITVSLKEGKTYDTGNTDANVAQTAREDLIKDLNVALQEAGLDSKVTASLSKDNEVQFISETGKDITLTNGAGNPLTAIGFSGSETVDNVAQVVGPGAQGSGFNTKFQIGANAGQSLSLSINDMRSAALGIAGNAGQAGFTASNSVTNGTNDIKAEAALNISNKENAAKSIEVIDKAIASVSSERGKLGAVQNRLEHTIKNLSTSSENLTSAESRIRDVDYALAA